MAGLSAGPEGQPIEEQTFAESRGITATQREPMDSGSEPATCYEHRLGLQEQQIADRVLCAHAVPGDDSARFLELWTVREAYLKAVGVGIDALGRELPAFLHGNDREVGWRFARVPVDTGYTASVVWKGPERPVVKRDL